MKKKAFLIMVLLGVLYTLSACSGLLNAGKTSRPGSAGNHNSQGGGNTQIVGIKIPKPSIPLMGRHPTATEDNPEELALVYCDTCDYNLYFGGTYTLYILSRYEIDMQDIQVISVGEEEPKNCLFWWQSYDRTSNLQQELLEAAVEDEENWKTGNFQHNEALYLTQQGIDWKEAADLKDAYNEATENGENPEAGLDEQDALYTYFEDYLAFYQGDMEDLADYSGYFVYEVVLSYEKVKELQILENIKLEIEGIEYSLDVGQIRIYPNYSQDPEFQAIINRTISSSGLAVANFNQVSPCVPWDNGEAEFMARRITVGENIILKNLYLLGEDSGSGYIKSALVGEYTYDASTNRTEVSEHIWDGESELALAKGRRIYIEFSAYIAALEGECYYSGQNYAIIEYETEKGPSYEIITIQPATKSSYYELCGMWLDGLSLKEYYTEYLEKQ